MKRIVFAAAVLGLTASSVLAADMVVKAKPPPPVAAFDPWDFAFGSALMSDYIFRGITQSNHKPSVAAYFEPRYNINKDLQLYVGMGGESIDFPNHAAAEIDFYGGIRPTFGKLALDFGAWYYWYPGGTCFNSTVVTGCNASLPNGNVIKGDVSFLELYAKATFNVTDAFSIGGSFYWSPSVLNSGADGEYIAGFAKYVFPNLPLPSGWGAYVSADVGYWNLGTSDNFYAVAGFPNGIPYKSYATWDLGFGVTYKVFTLDFRYYDTNLNKGDCNAFTSDNTARFTGDFTSINPGGFGSSWCGASFVVAGKFDLTAMSSLK
jgi:uncharacterized protein (TIGR02001 family)